jgi:transcriptional regulator with XRE-family HTH domain
VSDFGQFIRNIRKSRKLTLKVAAENLGIAAGYLCDLENGLEINPSAKIIIALEAYYGVSYSMLFESLVKDQEKEVLPND